jgi:LacI family transcriptional regulator
MPARRKRPTIRDIATETGLSPAAVSYALRGLQVPQETQRRVREAAERLGYEADPIARALASGRTGLVGVLCGSLADGWQQSVAAALGRGLLGADRNALIVDAANDRDREAALAKHLLDQRVDALITLPVDPRSAHWPDVASRTMLVAIGDALPGASTAAEIVFDNTTGVSEALRTLAAAGHTRVAVFTPARAGTPDRPAELVVQDVAPTLGVTASLVDCPHDLDGAAAVALSVLGTRPRPTAVFCLADSMAYGVYDAARSLGLSIPGDLSVLGYDDQPMSRILTPPLSTYAWPIDELVAAVVERVVRAIEDGRRSRRKVLTPEPRPRDSIAAPVTSRR